MNLEISQVLALMFFSAGIGIIIQNRLLTGKWLFYNPEVIHEIQKKKGENK